MRRSAGRSIWKQETCSIQSFEQAGLSVVGIRFNGANDETGVSCNESITGADIRAERDVDVCLSVVAVREATDGGNYCPTTLYGIIHSIKRKVTEILVTRSDADGFSGL